MEGWITTWKGIAKYVDRSIMTAKKYHKRYGMPVHRLPGGLPAIITAEVDMWLSEFSRLSKKKKENVFRSNLKLS